MAPISWLRILSSSHQYQPLHTKEKIGLVRDRSSTGSNDHMNEPTTFGSDSESIHAAGESVRRDDRHKRYLIVSILTNVVFLLSTTVLCVMYLQSMSASEWERTSSAFSPALMAVTYEHKQLNGSMYAQSKWKGKPTPELDRAWAEITDGLLPGPMFPISDADLQKIDKSDRAESTVRYPDEYGGGYMAGLEVFHQLHCLDFLRKMTFVDYYESRDIAFSDPPHVFRDHLDHCIDMLRQHIMCASDVGLVTGEWVQGYNSLYPDFSTWHQCRNFENIMEWAKEREVKIGARKLVRGEGVRQSKSPP